MCPWCARARNSHGHASCQGFCSKAEHGALNPLLIVVLFPYSKAHTSGASGGVFIEINRVLCSKGFLL